MSQDTLLSDLPRTKQTTPRHFKINVNILYKKYIYNKTNGDI